MAFILHYCVGSECSVRKTCLRHTQYQDYKSNGIEPKNLMRRCTSQKQYVQDTSKVNDDGIEYR